MRRTPGTGSTVAAAVSVLLCATACVFWVRSYQHCEAVGYKHWTGDEGVESRRGQLSLGWTRSSFSTDFPEEYQQDKGLHCFKGQVGRPGARDSAMAYYPGIIHHWHGFGFRWFVSRQGIVGGPGFYQQWHEVAFPYWLMVPFLLILPWRWRVCWRRLRARAGYNLCARSGYDPRATPSRCPECGAVSDLGKASATS